MPSLNFDSERATFKEYYRLEFGNLQKAEKVFRVLIESVLSSSDVFEPPIVTSRVKDCDECIAKFARKYQAGLEDAGTPYEIRNHITDLIGIRVTCYYETDIAEIKQVLQDNFAVRHVTDKTVEANDNEAFGYKGLHLDLTLAADRRGFLEYRTIQDTQVEVQVRTIVQNAWSELDHKIVYKRNIPSILQRRIRTLAALFELADREFVAVRDATEALSQRAQAPAEQAPEGLEAFSSPRLDAFHAVAIFRKYFPHYRFIGSFVDGFVSEILRLSPDFTVHDFEEALHRHFGIIEQYAGNVNEREGRRPNPFTKVRHALYLANPTAFEPILFDIQRHNLKRWIEHETGSTHDSATAPG